MKLETLLEAVDIEVSGPLLGERTVSGLSTDSRAVESGDLFFALTGTRTDAHRFIPDAIARGAVAIVAERRDPAWSGAPVLVTSDVRRCLGMMAARFYGDPTAQLATVGITGTNGKTTVAYLLEAMWDAAGIRAGVIGTVNYRYGDVVRPAPLTTPEALVLQATFAEMVGAGCGGAAVEVSSHALATGRVWGCDFAAGVFTNLSHDHLDFHGDLESYYHAKALLFLQHLPRSRRPGALAVINVDDPFGRRLAEAISIPRLTFGLESSAAIHPLTVDQAVEGLRGALSVDGRTLRLSSSLIGQHSVYNLMAAVGAAYGIGLPIEAIEEGIRSCRPIPGRLERLDSPEGFHVFVDYAHTPAALESALEAVRAVARGRVVTVFGCGGDRDRSKRPVMGGIAARLSDVVVLTSDNPRTEDPAAILADVRAGFEGSALKPCAWSELEGGARGYATEPDRRTAIEWAIRCARSSDVVLVAGKGHEDYQIVGTERRSFDDRAEVRRMLAEGRGVHS